MNSGLPLDFGHGLTLDNIERVRKQEYLTKKGFGMGKYSEENIDQNLEQLLLIYINH